MQRHPLPPAYVQSWDLSEFPTIDVHTSSVDVPLLHQTVGLTWGEFLDDGQPVVGWIVTSGFQRVAAAKVDSASNPQAIEIEVARWISEQQERDSDAADWHLRWRTALQAHPAVEAALSRGPAELYRRAGLTQPQELAMRQLFLGHSNTEAARELGISESSYRERIERAAIRIQELGTGQI